MIISQKAIESKLQIRGFSGFSAAMGDKGIFIPFPVPQAGCPPDLIIKAEHGCSRYDIFVTIL